MKKVVGGEVGSGVGKDLNQTIPETMMLALWGLFEAYW